MLYVIICVRESQITLTCDLSRNFRSAGKKIEHYNPTIPPTFQNPLSHRHVNVRNPISATEQKPLRYYEIILR